MESLEVLKLVEAGFTADEIRQMMKPQENNPQNPQVNPQPEPQPETRQETQPEPQPETQPVPQPNFDQLNDTMNKLIKTIQTANLHNNSTESISGSTDINTKVDQIMAGLIRPEHEKKGD